MSSSSPAHANEAICASAKTLTKRSRLPLGVIIVDRAADSKSQFEQALLIRSDGQSLLLRNLNDTQKKHWVSVDSLHANKNIGLIYMGETYYSYLIERSWSLNRYDKLDPEHRIRMIKFSSLHSKLFGK